MSERVQLDPEGLRRAATQFDGVADDARRLLDTLKTACTGRGEPWGDDHNGEKFADGEKGYKKNRDNTFESLSTLVDVLHKNADNLRDSAKTFEQNERELAKKKENAPGRK
ncbi:WXG100 family type VII secretion target [Nocardia gipuzkoensis]